MPAIEHPVPARLNLAIAIAQLATMLVLLWLASRVGGWGLLPLALAYGLVMNSAYAMLHEAEHGMAHPVRWLNTTIGVVLAGFFPAPFHLLRQGHLGHHLRNRSDDEAFDFYFEGESVIWKRLQLYGILTGGFWLVIAAGNLLWILFPWVLRPRRFAFDRPTEALLQSLNARFLPVVWLEAVGAVALHATLIWCWRIPFWHWMALMAGFGCLWSAMQYVHHFGTERHVVNGALNLRSWRWLDLLLLHHNWHLRHHQQPTLPWIHLPNESVQPHRDHVLTAYLRMWRGPRLTHERIENRHAGKIIR